MRLRVGVVVMWAMVMAMLSAGAPVARAQDQMASLYQRLGGRDGIALVVDDFVAFLVADERVNARFKTLKPEEVGRLKSHAADQVCEATGGPCAYLGRDMKTAHQGMKVTEDEWNAVVEDLVKALDKRKVGEPEKHELLDLLGPMKPDIVGQ